MNAIISHNKTVLSELEPGDTVKFERGLYRHYAVYTGNGEVIHLTGTGQNDGLQNSDVKHLTSSCGTMFDKAEVKKDKFLEVAGDSYAYKANEQDSQNQPLSRSQIVKNAISKLGIVGYNVLTSNCEHFANWCRYGIEKSGQTDGVVTGVKVVGGAASGLFLFLGLRWYFKEDTEKQ